MVPDPHYILPQEIPIFRDWESPTEGSSTGGEEDDPGDKPGGKKKSREPERRPKLKKFERAATESQYHPHQPPRRIKQSKHVKAKPGKRVKEVKLRTKTGRAFRFVQRVFEGAFESAEAIYAIYRALPKNVRDFHNVRANDPIGQMAVIYRFYHLLDLKKTVVNLVTDEIEDWVFGQLGRASQTSAQGLMLSTGIGFGGGARRAEVRAWRKRQAQDYIQFLLSETETFV